MASSTGTYFPYRTPHGHLTIRASARGITHVVLGDVELAGLRRPSALANRAATELLEYFAGKRAAFDVPLDAEGSAFQLAVWDELSRIPYGSARTSAEVASLMGCPGSYRAVGAAVRKNPLAVLVPDHRVVGSDGRPSGSGAAARLKSALLDMERSRLA